MNERGAEMNRTDKTCMTNKTSRIYRTGVMNMTGRMKLLLVFTLLLIPVLMTTLTGCESSPVAKVVFSNGEITDDKVLDESESLEKISAGTDLYANVLFIESPEGMKYNVKWVCDGSVVKEEEKQMTTNQKGVIAYLLEGDKLKKGSYTFEIYYKDKKIHEEKVTAE
jgi:hypothetical protein